MIVTGLPRAPTLALGNINVPAIKDILEMERLVQVCKYIVFMKSSRSFERYMNALFTISYFCRTYAYST